MLIFQKSAVINEKDDKTNIVHEFTVPKDTKEVAVKYSYSPKTVEDELTANRLIKDGMKKYNVENYDNEKYMPVKNLITLSFDECGKYRGACHRQANEQLIIIKDENSTPGIINRTIENGMWKVLLNVHFVGCRVDYSLEIEAKGDEI